MIKQFYLTNDWDTNRYYTSGSGCKGNEGVFHIPQRSRTEVSPSDFLVSY